jgi:arylformamidase
MARRHPPAWYDAEYHTRAAIPEHPAILCEWSERSAAARAAGPLRGDLAYGDGAGESLDLFPAARPGAPLLIYIHGGYWRALDKHDQSFVAPPFVAAGASVILPNYALAPAVSVEHIVRQMLRLLVWVWQQADALGIDRRRIAVAGHSAGGHLATMLLACRWHELAPGLPERPLRGALSISGLYDLGPLRHAPFLAPDLRLTAAGARRLSPVHIAAPAGPLFTAVGGDESASFHRQQRAIRRAWGADVVPVCETVPGRHHMNVLHELAAPGSRVFRLACGLLGL